MNNSRWIIVNGAWKEADECSLPAESRAVWYGDGCFETLRSYAGRFLKFGDHMARLKGSLDYLKINPPIDFAEGNVKSMIKQLLVKNDLQDRDAVVRFQIWRVGDRGFKTDSARPGYMLTALPLPEIQKSVKLATVSTRRIPSKALDPKYKLSNSANYIQAANEAAEQEADDALMLSIDDYISETTIANIFWLKEDKVYTPSKNCDILPGITRKMVIDVIEKQLETSIETGKYRLEEIFDAEAAWITNSIREVLPVRAIDGEAFPPSGSFLRELKSSFESLKKQLLV